VTTSELGTVAGDVVQVIVSLVCPGVPDEMLEIVGAGVVPVMVSACVYGEPVAPASVATMLMLYERGQPEGDVPTVRLDGTVVLESENCPASVPVSESVAPLMLPVPCTVIAPTVPDVPQTNELLDKEMPVSEGAA
jgi:hypothetical protein